MPIASAIKWHGGKSYLAKLLVAMMPPHLHYVEPYAGGLSVLMEKEPEGVSEVVNDLNGDLMAFWRVLAYEDSFTQFKRYVECVPFSEESFDHAKYVLDDPAEYASMSATYKSAAFFVVCRQSLAGRMKDFASISRNRTRRGMNEQVSAWLTAIEGLPEVHARLKRVLILNRPALDVIAKQDGDNTLFYLDPPYLHSTRTAIEAYGEFEMSPDDHRHLLDALSGLKGKFLLSGYPSILYNDYATRLRWTRVDFDLPNNAAGGEEKRRMTECVWRNF